MKKKEAAQRFQILLWQNGASIDPPDSLTFESHNIFSEDYQDE